MKVLLEARVAALFLILLLATTTWILRDPSEPHVRWSGALLLVTGLLLVFAQLLGTAKRYEHPSPWAGFVDWCRRLALVTGLIKPRSTTTTASMQAGTVNVTGALGMTVIRGERDWRVELADLRREFGERNTFVDERHARLVERIDADNQTVHTRLAAVTNDTQTVGKRVQDLAVGDLYTAMFGLALTLVGTVEAGWAPEIAEHLGWRACIRLLSV